MKAYQYNSVQVDGTKKVLLLSETEALKLCAAMTKDLYGTEQVLKNIVSTGDYIDKAIDLPEDVEFTGTWTSRRFKKERGQMYVWMNNHWELDAKFWHDEDARGKYSMR
jgi:hypothetical protein